MKNDKKVQKNDQDKKKRKKILLGCLFGVLGAGAVATAVAVPLSCSNNFEVDVDFNSLADEGFNTEFTPVIHQDGLNKEVKIDFSLKDNYEVDTMKTEIKVGSKLIDYNNGWTLWDINEASTGNKQIIINASVVTSNKIRVKLASKTLETENN